MKKIRAFSKKYLEDVLFFAGLLFILIGTIQINAIAGWFVGGLECIGAGVVLARSKKS